jgi:hypothetical protein
MTIIGDSYMRMILPEDISNRIEEFVGGKQNFPFIERDELVCLFYMYGKNCKVKTAEEQEEVIDLSNRTVAKIVSDIENYKNSSRRKMDSDFTRSKYINRGLQISVQNKANTTRDHILNDPNIVSDCFAQHVTYYTQEFFFQVYGPFAEKELITDIREILLGRMVMVGFNRSNEARLPFQHALVPLYMWLRDNRNAYGGSQSRS